MIWTTVGLLEMNHCLSTVAAISSVDLWLLFAVSHHKHNLLITQLTRHSSTTIRTLFTQVMDAEEEFLQTTNHDSITTMSGPGITSGANYCTLQFLKSSISPFWMGPHSWGIAKLIRATGVRWPSIIHHQWLVVPGGAPRAPLWDLRNWNSSKVATSETNLPRPDHGGDMATPGRMVAVIVTPVDSWPSVVIMIIILMVE